MATAAFYILRSSFTPKRAFVGVTKIYQPYVGILPSHVYGGIHSPTQRHQSSTSDSGENKGVFGWVRDKMENREKTKQSEKFSEQLEAMSNAEVWNIQSYANEIEASLSTWRTKIPGMSSVAQVKAVKETQKILKGMLDEVGSNATADDLNNLGRKEKLKISVNSQTPIDDINVMIKQFQNMALMHQTLRYRKQSGKPLPADEVELRMAMQQDGKNVLTKKQKRTMKETMSKRGGLGGKR